MDADKLKQMDASEAVWMCVQMSGKRRRELEEELELVPGQIDRWSSRKDHHSPSLAALPELVEATSCGSDPAQNVLIQWILARVADGNLKYDPKGMSADQMLHEIVHLGSEFGRVQPRASRQVRITSSPESRPCVSRRHRRTSSPDARP